MTAPTLSGNIPGLLRRGSPVVLAAPVSARRHNGIVVSVCRRGVVVDMERGASHAVVALESDADHDASLEWLPVGDLCLDLTDAAGQQNAGLYLWERPTPPGVDYSGLIRGATVGKANTERLLAAVLHVAAVAP